MPETRKSIAMLSDLSERVPYNVPELPIYAHRDPLSSYTDYRCPCHWHRDLEFIHVIAGRMDYFVNGVVTPLAAGEGLVVNSSRLHYGFSPEGTPPDKRECLFSCALVSPALFEGLTTAAAERCERAFDQGMDDFLTLSPAVDWQRDAMAAIDRLVGRMDDAARNPLPAVSAALDLCDGVLDRFRPADKTAAAEDPNAPNAPNAAGDRRDRMDVLAMTGLIQRRFADPLTLADIAAAGRMGRTRCCALFRRYVNLTPNEYLTDRRVREAKRLLDATAASVAEIARACGFSSPSYFISVFRRRTGLTPGEFRERALPSPRSD
ncbi:AraC family transcriptional regulator [Bifidobacterium avesanii]|uniref:Helix-turn-helix domain-containing protein n=1 Tax=Bifidobacterium avesanii TaxID=1798157 RepID=A0A7K3TI89_9BIFI|nr:AraC family transcriptional regulator [Bifidobacterium avesanii]NEG78394.1 helix-turn-helix domain-containing protein [Bifidobacterium avesanii]